MDQALFDQLQQTIQAQGAAPAIEQLCASMRERKEYASLFYALLMKKRHELGLSPVPTGPSSDIPANLVDKYEDGIRDAARLVGKLFLEQGDIAGAFNYFRMLNEVGPVAEALEQYQLPEGEDAQKIIELAFYHGGNPRRGYQWILERFGICSAITIMSGALQGGNFPHGTDARDACLKQLARSLHQQLVERLRYEITRREGKAPETNSVVELLAGRDWLFEEDNYHVDVSHLSSVVQMCVHLPKCEELALLREMCGYGEHLSPQFQSQGEAPFEDIYRDYGHYFDVSRGVNVEEGLAHFRKKADNPDPDYPNQNAAAELLVNLYLKLDRPADALAVARKYLAQADDRQLTCPNIAELCRKVNDYRVLAEVARERGDPVHFVAGLIAANSHARTK
jgi:hypothetical protein